MPSNRESKGKGIKGGNDDNASGLDKTGSQQNSDLASGPGDNAQRGDWGSRQSGSLDQGNQAQSDLGSGPGDNSRRGSQSRTRPSTDLDRSRQSDSLGGNMQSGGQGSRSSRHLLDQDDIESDDSLQR